MVTDFEDYSYELSEFEGQVLLPMVLASWNKKDPAEQKVVTMQKMISKVNKFCEKNKIYRQRKVRGGALIVSATIFKVDGPRMRKVIHHIRAHGLLTDLVATSDGYFRTNDPKQIANFIKSCRERANSFKEVADAMEIFNSVEA